MCRLIVAHWFGKPQRNRDNILEAVTARIALMRLKRFLHSNIRMAIHQLVISLDPGHGPKYNSSVDDHKRAKVVVLKTRCIMTRYRLKAPIQAIYHKPESGDVSVTLPAGAILVESVEHSRTLIGMVGVYWEGRHYSVSLGSLLRETEAISVA